MKLPLCVMCRPEELDQGLFGNVLYHAFQILPYLYKNGIFPAWEVRSLHYGDPPSYLTIPGAVDLSYVAPEGPYRRVSLEELRRRHAHVLGNNWAELHKIWETYFTLPARVVERADSVLQPGNILGIHYRGTDKQTTSWDSNPITQDQYLALIGDFLAARDEFDVIFAASDEYTFIEKLRASTKLPVVALGEVEFHMAEKHTVTRAEKTDRAVLDCVLLSRCSCVIQTSSALPSFAKVLNPSLEIYRCAASKLFGKLYSKMPYFPVAHVPVLPVREERSHEILRATMECDWTQDSGMEKFRRSFSFTPRWPVNNKVFSLTDSVGLTRFAAKVLPGYR